MQFIAYQGHRTIEVGVMLSAIPYERNEFLIVSMGFLEIFMIVNENVNKIQTMDDLLL